MMTKKNIQTSMTDSRRTKVRTPQASYQKSDFLLKIIGMLHTKTI